MMKQNLRLFKAGGASLEYFEAGSQTPVVFLPALGCSGTTYKEVIDLLSQSCHVFVPNLYFSINNYAISRLEDYVGVLQEFIKIKKLTNIILIGHSYGGAVALKLAESNKKNISKLILVDSAGLPVPYSLTQLFYLLFVKTWHELKYTNQLSILGRLVWDFSFFVLKSLPQWSKTTKEIGRVAQETQIQFQNIHVPTLLLWGKTDEILSLEYAEKLHKLLPNSKLIKVEGNHDWLLFRYKEYGKLCFL